jgi:hypothetical protein
LTLGQIYVLVLFMNDAASPIDAVPGDPSEDRAERRFRALQELTEIGMDLAREVRRQVLDPAAEAPGADLGLAFSRIARAVRQTVALEAKLDQDRQKSQAEAASRLAVETRLRGIRRKTKVRDIVERVIETEARESDAERLLDDLDERLEDADDTDFADRSVGELVAGICRDLGVTPDWGLWEDEDWGIEAAGVALTSGAPPDPRSANESSLSMSSRNVRSTCPRPIDTILSG